MRNNTRHVTYTRATARCLSSQRVRTKTVQPSPAPRDLSDIDGIIEVSWGETVRPIKTIRFSQCRAQFDYPTDPTAAIHFLRLILYPALLYLSMSFLTKFFRPFTTSMSSAPAQPMNVPEGAKAATVAAGCFWGVEHMYRREFGKKGLYDARVGYIGGDTQNPGYRAVCSGRTGRKLSLKT